MAANNIVAESDREQTTAGRARRDPTVPGAVAEKTISDALRKQYVVSGEKFFFRGDDQKLAFFIDDQKLRTEHNDPMVAKSMIDVAISKGWSSMTLSGSDEFKRAAWLHASLLGVEVAGFKPLDIDMARLNELREERARNTVKQAEKIAVANEVSKGRTTATRDGAVIAAVRSVARAKGYNPKSVVRIAEQAGKQLEALRGEGKTVAVKVFAKDGKPAALLRSPNTARGRSVDREQVR